MAVVLRVQLELTPAEFELVVQGLKMVRGSSTPDDRGSEEYEAADALIMALADDASALKREIEEVTG